MAGEIQLFTDQFDLVGAIETVRSRGYNFEQNSLTEAARLALVAEADSLPMEIADHITSPLNAGETNEVRQQHARSYYEYGDTQTPVGNFVIDSLTSMVRMMKLFPELSTWRLAEIGYQKYRPGIDFIGPHRDRSSDRLLSFTFTIAGSAMVKVFETLGDYRDYSKLRQTDEFETGPGTTMMLRAPWVWQRRTSNTPGTTTSR